MKYVLKKTERAEACNELCVSGKIVREAILESLRGKKTVLTNAPRLGRTSDGSGGDGPVRFWAHHEKTGAERQRFSYDPQASKVSVLERRERRRRPISLVGD